MSPRRVTTGLILMVIAGGAVLAMTGQSLLVGASRWLDVGEPPSCAEHVFLLPGDESYRPITAAAVIKAGLAEDILIPETVVNADVTDGLRPPTGEVLVAVLRDRGIPTDKIVCLNAASRTTYDDASVLSAFLEQRPQDRVIVVTNAFHTRRARFTFRRLLRENSDRLQYLSAPNPGFTDETWWQNRSSAKMVISENLKLGFYLARYTDAWVWFGSLLFIAILWRCRPWRFQFRMRAVAEGHPPPKFSEGGQ